MDKIKTNFERIFTIEDQIQFAKLSGDYNPIHVDEVSARRLIFGKPVVHGIHLLLWALECFYKGLSDPIELNALQADFLKPVGINSPVYYNKLNLKSNKVVIEVRSSEVVFLKLAIDITRVNLFKIEEDIPYIRGLPEKVDSKDWDIKYIYDASGTLDLHCDEHLLNKLFNRLHNHLPLAKIAQILASTRLVGVKCPGLHSIYSQLKMSFCNETPSDGYNKGALKYSVTKHDTRFNLLMIEVSGVQMRGEIRAFIRPSPQKQLSFSELKEIVPSDEFLNQHALVIGGSRGLGEITAKILAAGGAAVTVTYHQGVHDAERVVQEIRDGGRSANYSMIDILNLKQESFIGGDTSTKYTHIYYFATPFIDPGLRQSFSKTLYDRFYDYYINGFFNLFLHYKNHGTQFFFYPSSEFINDAPDNLHEYVMVKRMAAILCSGLDMIHSNILIHQPLLPRMATDQTASLAPLSKDNPLPVMLNEIRYFAIICAKTIGD